MAAWQNCPLAQALPHLPQLLASESRFEHTPLHAWSGALQVQPACTQLCSAVQAVAQVPQCWRSRSKSTHAPLQLVRPDEQLPWQAPFWHTKPSAQVLPHAPQLSGSLVTAMHAPPQRCWPLEQGVVVTSGSHRLAMQSMPSGHGESPGLPQNKGLVREQLNNAIEARATKPSVRSGEMFIMTTLQLGPGT